MKKLFFIPAALLLLIPALAEAPKDFKIWKGGDLKAYDAKLAPKAAGAQKLATETLGSLHGNTVVMVHRQANGEAELHDNWDDFTIVQAGSASVIIGGTVKEPRATGAGETRGTGIEGGETYKLEPGDVFNVPAKVAHQIIAAPGEKVTYLCYKVPAGK